MKHETDNSCPLSAKIDNTLEFHIRDKGRELRHRDTFTFIY